MHFMLAFETRVKYWLQDAASISTVASRLDVSWTMTANIMNRAVERGFARRKTQTVAHICVDETSYKRGHKYITVVSNPQIGTVLHVSEGRTKSSLKAWYAECTAVQLEQLESVSMDI